MSEEARIYLEQVGKDATMVGWKGDNVYTQKDWEKVGLGRKAREQGLAGVVAGLAAKYPEKTRGARSMPEVDWPLDAGVPTDNPQADLFPDTLSDSAKGAIMANLLTAGDRLQADATPQKGDMVTLPNHYARYPIEPIRFIGDNKLDWFQGNVVKYIVRHDAKNGLEDIRKVIRYAQMYLRFLDGDSDWWKAGKPEDLTNG